MVLRRIPTARRIRGWPVRWRLTLVSASLTFVILLLFGAVVGDLAAERVRSDFNREIEDAATRLVAKTRIIEQPFSEPVVRSPYLNAVSVPNGAAARIVDIEGRIFDQVPSQGVDLGPVKPGLSTHGSLAVATVPITGAQSQVVGYVQYGRSTSELSTTITKLWLFIIGGVIGGTVLAILAGLALASRAMRPIASLTATAREVATTQDPSRRLPEPTSHDEVGELTHTLQQMLTALDTARTDREAALQKQREFVADASHELRTPLTSILANLELLEAQLSSVGETEEHEVVTSAVRSSRRMSRLVADLLFLARSDAGQRRAMSDCDLAEVAEGAAREVSSKLGDRVLDTEGCESVIVRGNQDDLHRLVLNLLDNAIRYSPPRTRIAVRTGVEGGSALIEVADGGPGIPAGMRDRVFERFVRSGNGSDTRSTDGTGLGLAMVRAIAEAHGGSVAAGASRELGGASILVTLPLGSAGAGNGRVGQRTAERSAPHRSWQRER
jgi:signal transduction histidine kinase